MTWKELKTVTLQKVFAITDGRLVEDDTTREYLTAMPGAANEGLQLLATAGRFIKKQFVIRQEGEVLEDGGRTQFAPTGTGINRYDLAEMVDDFYSLDADGVYYEGNGIYCRPADWTMEGGHVLVLPAEKAGTWTIHYNAYPPELSAETLDGYELSLYPEVAALLPLYMASQLYKDDDISIAVQYRNEFEVGRDALMAAAVRGQMGRDEWRETRGWW